MLAHKHGLGNFRAVGVIGGIFEMILDEAALRICLGRLEDLRQDEFSGDRIAGSAADGESIQCGSFVKQINRTKRLNCESKG